MQYYDLKWIKHFKINIEFVGQLIMNLKHLMQKEHNMSVVFMLHALFTSMFIKKNTSINATKCLQLAQVCNPFGFVRVYVCNQHVFQESNHMVRRGNLALVMVEFKEFCGQQSIHGAIHLFDNTLDIFNIEKYTTNGHHLNVEAILQ